MTELEKKIRFSILDLAEEDAYGSWELFGGVKQDIADIFDENTLRTEFLNIIETLIKEKKLIALSYKDVNKKYTEVVFDRSRLEFEIKNTDKIDGDTYYWFEATEDGVKEYNVLYKELKN
jgi:hypothetical protein